MLMDLDACQKCQAPVRETARAFFLEGPYVYRELCL